MANSPELKAVMRELTGDMTDREIAEAVGLSHPYVNQIRNGKAPSLDVLLKIDRGLRPKPELRTRLFLAAGSKEVDAVNTGRLSDEAAEIAKRVEALPPKKRDLMRLLLENHGMLDAVEALRGVIYGEAISA